MKKALITLAFLALCGCNGVRLAPEYSKLLDQTTALSEMSAQLAEDGKLTEDQKTAALRGNANAWHRFRHARDGVTADD